MGIDWDPPVCHDVQVDIMTERQPAAVLLCCCGGWLVGLLWCVAVVRCSCEVDMMYANEHCFPEEFGPNPYLVMRRVVYLPLPSHPHRCLFELPLSR